DVGPRPRRGVHGRVDRIDRARESDGRGLHVLAESCLDRGLAVTEHVIRDAEPRRDVLPTRHVADRLEMARADPRAAWRILRFDLVIEVVEADAGVDGEFANRPLVLGVAAE